MKREILFKAVRIDNGEWAFGFLALSKNKDVAIIFDEDIDVNVDAGTICQFTGQTNDYGQNIFDGDKFNTDEDDGSFLLVEWENELSMFCVNLYGYAHSIGEGSQDIFDTELSKVDSNLFSVEDLHDLGVIGNIHDKIEKP